MLVLNGDSEAQLISFARAWCSLVAQKQWASALAMFDEPNHYGIEWTADAILSLVAEEFGESVAFSMPDVASGEERHHFGRLNDGSFWLDYDVPLNGAFSDLTAQFEFHRRGDAYAAVLHDLHVM